MKKLLLGLMLAASLNALAAPAVESYFHGLMSLSSGNDERGEAVKAEIVKSMDITGKENSGRVIEIHVSMKDLESGTIYAKDVYLVTVGSYASLKTIQFVERIVLEKE